MQLRTIHVGVANRGNWPLEVMGADPRFAPVALVDIQADALIAARQKIGRADVKTFDDLSSAIESVDADAVVICSPTQTHTELCRLAFDAGKHVLVEKGMASDWNDAVALVRRAERANVKFCVAQNYRYHANEIAIQKILGDRNHPHFPGDVRIVDYTHHRYRPEPRTLNYPFAVLWDMGCHHIDSLSCWLGEAVRVTAHTYNTPWSKYAGDANIAAIIEYESGAVCNYVLTHTATLAEWRVILQGDRGALRTYDVPGVQFFAKPAAPLGSSAAVACDVPTLPRSEQSVAGDFHSYVAGNTEPGISGRNNLQTLRVCEMLIRSAREGRSVHADDVRI